MERKYIKAVNGLLQASNAEALAHNREIRDGLSQTVSQILEQRLVSFRLALKIGNGRFLDPQELVVEGISDTHLLAESYFVRGMILIHQDFFKEAMENFTYAKDAYFRSGNIEKAFLAQLNAIIANANGGLITAQEDNVRKRASPQGNIHKWTSC